MSRMKKVLIVPAFIMLVMISSCVSCQQKGDRWTSKAELPTARYDLSTSVVDGKIYAIGGRNGNTVLSTVEEYDPASNIWVQKSDMPTARCCLSTSVVDGKIYAIGGVSDVTYGTTVSSGYPILSIVEEYNPATDTWIRRSDMPTPRHCLSTSVVEGKIYAIGGMSDRWHTDFTIVEEYAPATDTWTQKADMPTPRHWLSTSVVDGKIYAIGGKLEAAELETVEEYDPVTDTWIQKANMPTRRWGLSTSAVDGKIYAIGGTSGWAGWERSMKVHATVEQYDPKKDTWTPKADMPTARCCLSTSVVDGKIYAIAGSLGGWNKFVATSAVEEYVD